MAMTSRRFRRSRPVPGVIVLVTDSGGHFIGKFPVLENGLADGGMPVLQYAVEHGGVDEQLGMTHCPRQNVEFADAVHDGRPNIASSGFTFE